MKFPLQCTKCGKHWRRWFDSLCPRRMLDAIIETKVDLWCQLCGGQVIEVDRNGEPRKEF